MATSNIIPPNPLLFPTCVLAFVLPIAPQPQILSLALSVDKVNLFSFNINCAHDNAIDLHALAQTKPPSPLRRPKLFIIPAKRAVVSDIFAYIARRVMMLWEWEKARASAPSSPTVHLKDFYIWLELITASSPSRLGRSSPSLCLAINRHTPNFSSPHI